jgi:hypothetical protein
MSLLFRPKPWSDLPEALKPCWCTSCIVHRYCFSFCKRSCAALTKVTRRDGLVENKRRKFRLVASREKDDRFFVSEEVS